MVRRAASVAALVTAVILVGGWIVVYSGLLGGPIPTATPRVIRTPPARSSEPSSRSTPGPSTSVPAASTPPPIPTPIDTNVHASAMVVPVRSADLAMAISGLVNTVYFHANDQVIGGQLLLKLDQTTYLSEIVVAAASVDQAQAAVDDATLTVEQMPADAPPPDLEAAQAALKLAQTNLELAHSQLSAAQAALRQTELRAPFAGTIATIDVAPGEQVTAGQTVASIGDMSTWLIETTDLTEIDVVRVAVGDRATITFTALPGVTGNGVVDSVQVRGTNKTGEVSFAVTIRPDSFLPQLRWNMSADVSIVPSS